jgi:ketosteroid isomerase-like protein
MKRVLLVTLLVFAVTGMAFAQGAAPQAPQRGAAGRGAATPPPTGPIADLANGAIDAINKADATFFETRLAADVVWFDEDGHAIAGKDRVLNFVKTKLLVGGKKVTITNLRVGDDWAGYVYTVDAAGKQIKGTQTIVYKKVGADWQIAMVHGAVAAAGHGE